MSELLDVWVMICWVYIQVTMKEEQRSYYKELLAQVDKWMSSMERRIESLDPVAMDMQLIESQIESLQVTIY